MYRTYDENNFKRFSEIYDYIKGGAGFYKPNLAKYAKPEDKFWTVEATKLYQHNSKLTVLYITIQQFVPVEAYLWSL